MQDGTGDETARIKDVGSQSPPLASDPAILYRAFPVAGNQIGHGHRSS